MGEFINGKYLPLFLKDVFVINILGRWGFCNIYMTLNMRIEL